MNPFPGLDYHRHIPGPDDRSSLTPGGVADPALLAVEKPAGASLLLLAVVVRPSTVPAPDPTGSAQSGQSTRPSPIAPSVAAISVSALPIHQGKLIPWQDRCERHKKWQSSSPREPTPSRGSPSIVRACRLGSRNPSNGRSPQSQAIPNRQAISSKGNASSGSRYLLITGCDLCSP